MYLLTQAGRSPENQCAPFMLELTTTDTGISLLRSPLIAKLGVPHAFTTRGGGVSPSPFDSLNLATPSPDGDDEATIRENFARATAAIGCPTHQVVRVTQVHGKDVLAVTGSGDTNAATCADSLITAERGRLLCIRVADCVPILIAATDQSGIINAVAAVHAGWRGITANILAATVHRLAADHGITADHLFAAVGPCIRVEHFEVGPEVADEFASVGLDTVVSRAHGSKPHIDLTEAARLQLIHEGVPASHIDTGNYCTFRDASLLFSHRRDQGKTGRQTALIAMP